MSDAMMGDKMTLRVTSPDRCPIPNPEPGEDWNGEAVGRRLAEREELRVVGPPTDLCTGKEPNA